MSAAVLDEEPVLIARRNVSLDILLNPFSLTLVVAEDVVDDAVEPDRCNNKRESFLDGRMELLDDDDLPLLMLLLSTLT